MPESRTNNNNAAFYRNLKEQYDVKMSKFKAKYFSLPPYKYSGTTVVSSHKISSAKDNKTISTDKNRCETLFKTEENIRQNIISRPTSNQSSS